MQTLGRMLEPMLLGYQHLDEILTPCNQSLEFASLLIRELAHLELHAYRDFRYRERDIARDRYRLKRDLAYGDWGAARAQRADIYRDLNQMRGDRFDMNYGYPYGY